MRFPGSAWCGGLLLLLAACQSPPAGSVPPGHGGAPTAEEIQQIEQRVVTQPGQVAAAINDFLERSKTWSRQCT